MMPLKQRSKPSKRPLFIGLAIAAGVVLLGVAAWYFLLNKQNNSSTNTVGTDGVNVVDYNPPTEEEKQATEEQKDAIIKQQENAGTPTDATLAITISRVFQDPSGINLRTVVSGTSTGECIATFTKSGQPTVTKTFTVTFEATSAFCENALVPTSEFATSGTWELSLVVKKGSKQSAPATMGVDVTK